MNCSKEAQAFINLCYKYGQPVVIHPKFNEKYTNANDYKFTKVLFEEIAASGQVKVLEESEKYVRIMGIEGADIG